MGTIIAQLLNSHIRRLPNARKRPRSQVSFPSGSLTDPTPWGERGTHSETLPWATTLCWLGSGCACARPPTHRRSQRNTALQISSGAQLQGGWIQAHRGAPAQSPNPRLDAIQHVGQHAQGSDRKDTEKIRSHTLCLAFK